MFSPVIVCVEVVRSPGAASASVWTLCCVYGTTFPESGLLQYAEV
jgi:hypothetical protein